MERLKQERELPPVPKGSPQASGMLTCIYICMTFFEFGRVNVSVYKRMCVFVFLFLFRDDGTACGVCLSFTRSLPLFLHVQKTHTKTHEGTDTLAHLSCTYLSRYSLSQAEIYIHLHSR